MQSLFSNAGLSLSIVAALLVMPSAHLDTDMAPVLRPAPPVAIAQASQLAIPLSPATTLTLYPSTDTFVSQSSPTASFGSGTYLRVARNEFLEEHRTFLQFPLGSIPTGSTIHTATLWLYLRSADCCSPIIQVRRVITGWNSAITWNTQPGVSSSNYASVTVPSVKGVYVAWDVTLLVDRWVNQPATYPNHGLRLHSPSTFQFYRLFDSLNYTGTTTSPQLVVNYSAPPPPHLLPRAFLPNVGRQVPSECVTKAAWHPGRPNWGFVMNFEKVQNGQPIGCLLVFTPTVASPSYYFSVPCSVQNPSGLAFADGQATFSGGWINCPVNIQAMLAGVFPLADVETEEHFLIYASGALAPGRPYHPYGNPVVYYLPNDPALGLGLFLPITATTKAVMTSRFNYDGTGSLTNLGTLLFSATSPQTWTVKHSSPTCSAGACHFLGLVEIQHYSYPGVSPVVRYGTNGGTFIIGASPLGPSFQGTLEEVIVDPGDYGADPR